MPMCSSSPPITSLSLCSVMNCTAAGQRCSIFSRSCKNDAGGSTMRLEVAPRRVERLAQRERGPLVGARGEAAGHVARADAQLQHHRRVAGLGQRKAVVHRLNDRRQVRLRVEQPHLRLHRECMAALLHDAGAFAVVFADDDQRAARHARRREVGQGVGGHVGADGRLPRRRATHRVVHRGRQRRRCAGLARRRFEVHAELIEDRLRVGQHVHQVRDRRALVTGDVAHAGLEQRLGHREDALAVELGALRHGELLHLAGE